MEFNSMCSCLIHLSILAHWLLINTRVVHKIDKKINDYLSGKENITDNLYWLLMALYVCIIITIDCYSWIETNYLFLYLTPVDDAGVIFLQMGSMLHCFAKISFPIFHDTAWLQPLSTEPFCQKHFNNYFCFHFTNKCCQNSSVKCP